MAETVRVWQLHEALQARLQEIQVANGYRTDAGDDVRLEPSSLEAGTRITIHPGQSVRPDDARSPGEREVTLIVEAVVPVELENPNRLVVAIAEDIEQALDAYLPMPSALPLQFQESLFLDKPDGVPAMAAQLMFSTRFRR